METIAIFNRKGGTGKTVTAFALGAGLMKQGYKVLFVDLDSQQNLSFDLAAKAGDISAMDVLTRRAAAEQAIIQTQEGDIIPAGPELAGADILLTGDRKEYGLKDALEQIKRKYDFVVIDTPPALGNIAINALTAANYVIIPAQAEIHSLQGIGLLQETIATVRKRTNHNLKIAGILVTRHNGRAIISKDMLDNMQDIAKALNTKVYSTPIRNCTALQEAEAMQQNIYDYARRSNAAADYKAFVKEFLKGRNGK